MALVDNIERIVAIIGLLGGATGVLYARRARKAEVRSREVDTADQMIELMKKTYDDVLNVIRGELESIKAERENDRRENERLRKCVTRLERAIKQIATCDHRDECPIANDLHEFSTKKNDGR